MKARKQLALLGRDVVDFLLGRSRLRSAADAADAWIHPVDADFYLDDPEAHMGPFDAAGLPMQRFGGAEPVYVPSRTAAFAFVHWNRWRRTKDEAHLRAFLQAARWFAEFTDGRIEHRFDLAGMAAPWISGLAQGEALSIFARAELVEPGQWRARCEPVLTWMTRPIAQGGVADVLPDGGPFLEEYPGTRHRHVLNGCLYALVGLGDFLRLGAHAEGQALFDGVAAATARNLAHWEDRGWSLYEYRGEGRAARGNYNTPGYQIVHIALLRAVGPMGGGAPFLEAADRLERALRHPLIRARALAGKLLYRFHSGW